MNEELLEFSVVFSGRAHYAQQTVVLLLRIVRRTVGKGVENRLQSETTQFFNLDLANISKPTLGSCDNHAQPPLCYYIDLICLHDATLIRFLVSRLCCSSHFTADYIIPLLSFSSQSRQKVESLERLCGANAGSFLPHSRTVLILGTKSKSTFSTAKQIVFPISQCVRRITRDCHRRSQLVTSATKVFIHENREEEKSIKIFPSLSCVLENFTFFGMKVLFTNL